MFIKLEEDVRSLSQRDFRIAQCVKLFNKNTFTFLSGYPKAFSYFKQEQRNLIKENIYVEFLSSKSISKGLFPVAGSLVAIGLNDLSLLAKIPAELDHYQLVVTNKTIYTFSTFQQALSFNKSNANPFLSVSQRFMTPFPVIKVPHICFLRCISLLRHGIL